MDEDYLFVSAAALAFSALASAAALAFAALASALAFAFSAFAALASALAWAFAAFASAAAFALSALASAAAFALSALASAFASVFAASVLTGSAAKTEAEPKPTITATRTDQENREPKELFEGTETILLVEDEESLRKLTCEVLQVRHFTVLEAIDGLEAL